MNKEIEIWKSLDFLGYSNYEVSNFGKVKSLNYLRTGKERILKSRKNNNNYLLVGLYKNAKGKSFLVHRLVCLAFLENPNNYPCVNHKDENPSNNHISNLEWCTHEYNMNYGTINERISKKLKRHKVSEETKQKIIEARKKPILQYTLSGVFIKEFDSAKSASIELNIDSSAITACCKGKRCKSVGGYIWRYKNNK